VSVLVEQNSQETVAKAFVDRIAEGIQRARACMEAAQQRYKQYLDSGRIDVQFNVGDEVMLSTKNLKLTGTKKLSARYIGPFKVVKVINPVAYELDLPLQYGSQTSIRQTALSHSLTIACQTEKLWRTGYPHGVLVLSGFSRRLVLWIERLFLDRNVRSRW
jgi:hypothetical protein